MAKNFVAEDNQRNVEDKGNCTVWQSCKIGDDKGNTAYTARCKVLRHNKAVDACRIKQTADNIKGKVTCQFFKRIFFVHIKSRFLKSVFITFNFNICANFCIVQKC